ncbi:cell wall-binding repeat-containing protein [Clostridium sp. JNZ X4-2]
MQKSSKKVLSACSVASLLIAGTTLPTAGVKAADSSDAINRLGGQNRYETAAKVAQSGWTSSDYAIVANGEGYADALCAIPLAKAKDAPVLLTTGDNLNENALNELKSLNVKHVIVVGGTGVVSENALNDIKAQVSDVQRLGGQDRYETSVKIAQALASTSAKAVVASGEGYADALSAGPAAAINGMPILLTRQNSLPDAEADYLKATPQITSTYVIGGTMSVSDSTANSLPSPKRLSGTDRYETNVAVLKEFASDFNFGNIYAALGNGPTGNEFADALTGGALAAKNKNPLIITGYTLSSATSDFLKDKANSNTKLTVLGGTLNISDSLADSIKGSFGTGTTPGGGGGGDTTATNITATLKANDSYNEIVDSINNSQYFKILKTGDTGDDANNINVQLKKSGINTPAGIFKDAETRYKNNDDTWNEQQIEDDVAKLNDKLTIVYGKNIKVGKAEVSLSIFIGGLGSRYIDSEGKLKSDTIITEIKTKGSDYAYKDFRDDVNNKIDYYFDNNSSAPKDSITVKVMGLTVNNIKKGSTPLFDSSSAPKVAAENLVNKVLFPDGNYDLTGTYTINVVGNSYVQINIKK